MKYTLTQIKRIRENLKLCKFNTKYGSFTVNRSESLKHNLAMARMFTILSYEGFCVACRPVLKNKQKPDLLVLDTQHPYAKEVMVTESDKQFAKKNYIGIKKIKVKCQ